MAPLSLVTQIEAAGLVAWPALETASDGGWVMRAAGGYTKRANSVQCHDPADDADAPARIERAADWFRARDLPPVFRITPLAGPGVRTALAAAGWADFDASNVLGMELDGDRFGSPADHRLEGDAPTSPGWLSGQQDLQTYDDATAAGLQALVAAIKAPARGFTLRAADGRALASALLVVAEGMAVAGNVVVEQRVRGQGFGRRIMEAALGWAARQGGRYAALNVMADNPPAHRLYAGLGYRHIYDYHYCRPGP